MAQGEFPWAALFSEDLCCLPFSPTSLSHTVQRMWASHTLRARAQVSVSGGARCESSTIQISLNKFWERKARKKGGREERERTREYPCHCVVVGINDSNRPGCHHNTRHWGIPPDYSLGFWYSIIYTPEIKRPCVFCLLQHPAWDNWHISYENSSLQVPPRDWYCVCLSFPRQQQHLWTCLEGRNELWN